MTEPRRSLPAQFWSVHRQVSGSTVREGPWTPSGCRAKGAVHQPPGTGIMPTRRSWPGRYSSTVCAAGAHTGTRGPTGRAGEVQVWGLGLMG